jgi:hypothetical protein
VKGWSGFWPGVFYFKAFTHEFIKGIESDREWKAWRWPFCVCTTGRPTSGQDCLSRNRKTPPVDRWWTAGFGRVGQAKAWDRNSRLRAKGFAQGRRALPKAADHKKLGKN